MTNTVALSLVILQILTKIIDVESLTTVLQANRLKSTGIISCHGHRGRKLAMTREEDKTSAPLPLVGRDDGEDGHGEKKHMVSEENVSKDLASEANAESPSFLSQISWPNLIIGSLLGTFITIVSLFGPFVSDAIFNDENYDQLSPKYTQSSVEAIAKPVELFEDILMDLQAGYVDEVEPNKLFETATSAMLKSLDPYTEFENMASAKAMQESVSGKYGGVGMVISATKDKANPSATTALKREDIPLKDSPENSPPPPPLGEEGRKELNNGGVDNRRDTGSSSVIDSETSANGDAFKGIIVVDAFEGYAYDAGIRAGDRLLSIGGVDLTGKSVEEVRDMLRGDPDTDVEVTFQRDGLDSTSSPSNVQKATIKRQSVHISDVRLATFLGDPNEGIGYIGLSGFNAGAGRDFRSAFLMLRYSAPQGLKGLVLDLRGNPGGLLDAAVEIASYLVPSKSDIVTAKSKSGPEITYRSTIDPIRPEGMKLAVLVNGASASASEIVAGAIQDLDAGVIVGPTRTYGKGLVQKIVPLPYSSALKFTIAKYYTPSGRCIQAVKYSGGRSDVLASAATSTKDGTSLPTSSPSSPSSPSSLSSAFPSPSSTLSLPKIDSIQGNEMKMKMNKNKDTGKSDSTKSTTTRIIETDKQKRESELAEESARSGDGARFVAEDDRKTFLTKGGRIVRDGGGIEPDVQVPPLKTSPSATIFTSQGVYYDFVSDFFKHNTKLRPLLADVSKLEHDEREKDFRFASVKDASPVLRQFLVLPEVADLISQQDSKLNAAVNDDAYWGGKRNHISSNTLFSKFNAYAQKRIRENQIDIDGPVKAQITQLEIALTESGLDSATSKVEELRRGIKDSISKDMVASKDLIVEDLEIGILSRELPDRLLMYKAVSKDPQVAAAKALLVDTPKKTNEKIDENKTPSLDDLMFIVANK